MNVHSNIINQKNLVYENIINDKDIILKDEGTEKYGRALAAVELLDGRDLTTLLIEQGIGKEYHGEKKMFFSLSVLS